MSDINQPGRPPAMTPFSHASHTAQGQRTRGRTGSNSSASSAASAASTRSHDQFVFSPHQTPASEKEPFFSHQEYAGLNRPGTHSECKPHPLPSLVRIVIAPAPFFVRGSKLGKRTLVWRASVASIAATAITSAVHHDGSQAVAPGTIGPISTGSSVQLSGGGTLSNHVQPYTWRALVVAQRVWHRQAFGEFHTSRCGRTRASGIT